MSDRVIVCGVFFTEHTFCFGNGFSKSNADFRIRAAVVHIGHQPYAAMQFCAEIQHDRRVASVIAVFQNGILLFGKADLQGLLYQQIFGMLNRSGGGDDTGRQKKFPNPFIRANKFQIVKYTHKGRSTFHLLIRYGLKERKFPVDF